MNMEGTHVRRLQTDYRGTPFDIEVPQWGVRVWRSVGLFSCKGVFGTETFSFSVKTLLNFKPI